MMRGRLLYVIVFTAGFCLAQEPVAAKPQDLPDKTTPLRVIASHEVVGVGSPLISLPLSCSSDHTVFVRMASTIGVDDLIAIPSNGKDVVQFRSDRINDINKPVTVSFFATDSEIDLLITAGVPETGSMEIRSPTGDVTHQQKLSRRYYVARFKRDGSYDHAVVLDVPFKPFQIGVFENGDFLIAGAKPFTDEPALALVKSNGQFQRYVKLEGDVHAIDATASEQAKQEDPTALPRQGDDSLLNAAMRSVIVRDGRNLILFRRGQRSPLYSVSPGGQVETRRLKFSGDYELQELKPTANSWVALLLRRNVDNDAPGYRIFDLDRESGEAMGAYTLPQIFGVALACVDRDSISFLTRANEDGKLVLVTLATDAAKRSVPSPPR